MKKVFTIFKPAPTVPYGLGVFLVLNGMVAGLPELFRSPMPAMVQAAPASVTTAQESTQLGHIVGPWLAASTVDVLVLASVSILMGIALMVVGHIEHGTWRGAKVAPRSPDVSH